MAITINRTLGDGAQTASFEIVSDGDAGGESGTAIDVSTLSGGRGDNTERVRITRIEALVCGDSTNLSLSWDGDDVFFTIPEGSFCENIVCIPTEDATGDVLFEATADTPFTLRLYVEKAEGYTLSMARGL